MVVRDGYKCEIYEVTTDDGYILKLHRVMAKRNGRITKKHPVFLMHGLFGSSVTYVLTGPDNAIGNLILSCHN